MCELIMINHKDVSIVTLPASVMFDEVPAIEVPTTCAFQN
jgi:hypothetical protein